MSRKKRRPSDHLIDWLRSPEARSLGQTERLFAYVVGSFLDSAGVAFPGEAYLAEITGYSPPQVQRLTRALRSDRGPFVAGSIQVKQGRATGPFVVGGRPGNGRTSAYRLKDGICRSSATMSYTVGSEGVAHHQKRRSSSSNLDSGPSIKGEAIGTVMNSNGTHESPSSADYIRCLDEQIRRDNERFKAMKRRRPRRARP
jgi:hypothetical protein